MEETSIGAAAGQATDATFANQISSFVKLTQAEISVLFPTQNDQKQLAALIDVMSKATDDNERAAKLISAIGSVAGAVVKLLKTSAIPVV